MTKGTGLVPVCVRMLLNLALSTGLPEVKILPEGAGENEIEACLGEGSGGALGVGNGKEKEGGQDSEVMEEEGEDVEGGEEEGESLVSDGDDALDVVVFDGYVLLLVTPIEQTVKATNSTILSTEPFFLDLSVMCQLSFYLSLTLSLSLST